MLLAGPSLGPASQQAGTLVRRRWPLVQRWFRPGVPVPTWATLLILHPGTGYGKIPTGWYALFGRKERPVKATIDTLEFRRVPGHFPTGVAIVTALDAAWRPAGLSVGSFLSISLVPSLVGLCLAKRGGYRCARGRHPGGRDHEDRSRSAR
jgi:hypothetical protein